MLRLMDQGVHIGALTLWFTPQPPSTLNPARLSAVAATPAETDIGLNGFVKGSRSARRVHRRWMPSLNGASGMWTYPSSATGAGYWGSVPMGEFSVAERDPPFGGVSLPSAERSGWSGWQRQPTAGLLAGGRGMGAFSIGDAAFPRPPTGPASQCSHRGLPHARRQGRSGWRPRTGGLSFGDAQFAGSMGEFTLNAPVVGTHHPTASGAIGWRPRTEGSFGTRDRPLRRIDGRDGTGRSDCRNGHLPGISAG
jgi:hypothetical protein